MIKGSNNSLTYLKPSSWWTKMFNFGRCQRVSYDIQYNYHGIRFFDFRLYVNDKNHIIAKNGKYKYELFSFYEILDFLNKKGDSMIMITLDFFGNETLEQINGIEKKFSEICYIIEYIYHNIGFCGGYRRSDNKKLYTFAWEEKNGTMEIINPSEDSRFYKLITKWYPRYIDKINKQYIEKYNKEHVVLMLNYVDKH